ncbi:DNA gyrase subunit A, partial [Candidatus Collierbacteria bacterium]|nr:DNA gyrase subunit A [Candidatus Collierbacteria bacterium]
MDNQPEKTKFGLIQPTRIVEEMEKSYLDYAMSVIVSRALPDVRDGLKPVHRRILFAMKEMGLTHKSAYKKSARVVGEVLGKYHPHGDQAVYQTMVRLAQDFSMRYPLIDGQGNFGSIDGDSAAAMRYTEARLSKIADPLLEDIDKNTVDFVDNFDGSQQEPTVLPAKLPNLLLMGSDGIAVGMATKIPPHNLNEVASAVTAYIDRGKVERETINETNIENESVDKLVGKLESDIEIEELTTHIKGPDFPTAGAIYDQNEIKKLYLTGKANIVNRGVAEIVEKKSGRYQIVITQLPYQVNKSKLITHIAELVKKKKIEGISDLRDESDRRGMTVVVELKRDAKPKSLLNNLYKYTELQSSFPANVVALTSEGVPHLLNLKQIITEYTRHRQNVVVRRSQFELKDAKARAHILEGLLKALDVIDEVIETIKKSESTDTA